MLLPSFPLFALLRRSTWLIALCLGAPGLAAASAVTSHAREYVLQTTASADSNWDSRAGFLWNGAARTHHGVRATSWYILALMLRDAPGDRDRALHALRAVLAQQINEPSAAWHGTFFRRPEEPAPRHDAKIWQDYDPNWRQFIGTAFALLLLEFEDRIPPADRARIDESLRLAVEGELHHGRLQPTYTNIALMHGFLQAYAGRRLQRPEWVQAGEAWMEAVYAAYQPHATFEEFNSPTYYGVDLYGLALLRRHGVTPRLRELGATMEQGLWREIAQSYHAGLRNLAGPFDRTYGMDLRRYVSLTGAWLRLAFPENQAPLPPLSTKMAHGNDLFFIPCFALLGVEIPADALPHFTRFSGERLLTRKIGDGRRVATSWLGTDLLIGGESTSLSRDTRGPQGQFRPATLHWRLPDDDVGWIALIQSSRVDAEAAPHSLSIRAIGDSTFRIYAPGASLSQLKRDHWSLPGLEIRIETDARDFSVQPAAEFIDVTFHAATRFNFSTRTLRSPATP
jgi:hypothetical protein